MQNFPNSFTFDRTTCVVDSGDFRMAFNRFTGRVVAQEGSPLPRYTTCYHVLLVDIEEFVLTYGERPPNETLTTMLDFGYWYLGERRDADGELTGTLETFHVPPDRGFREAHLSCMLAEAAGFPEDGSIRSLEVRPWRHELEYDDDAGFSVRTAGIEECKPEDAEGWGVYGRTAEGPAYHLLDAGNRQAAHCLRALLAPVLIARRRVADPYEAAAAACEALELLDADGQCALEPRT